MENETKIIEPRTCGNCACCEVKPHAVNKLQTQAFCKLKPPTYAQIRADVPRLTKEGQPVIGKNNQPVMEPGFQEVYLSSPTDVRLVCFDGWRPIGTLPGDRYEMADVMGPLRSAFSQLGWDLIQQSIDDTGEKH
jgi:hypothetical protein